MRKHLLYLVACLLAVVQFQGTAGADSPVSTSVVSLDGSWLLAPDPQNVGRENEWYAAATPEAKRTPVPWIIQEVFPGYHGVAWYWREFTAPVNPHPVGRYLLRFWAVDYLADVWINGVHVGTHEGGEDPFVLDVTEPLKPGAVNRIAVRVLNPTPEPIDGIGLHQTPRRNKTAPYSPGSDFNYGGITDSVELLVAPAVRVEDLFVRPDAETGVIRIRANVRNAGKTTVPGHLDFGVAPANSGETLDMNTLERELPPGDTAIEATLTVTDPRLWELNDPAMYRVTARVRAEDSHSTDERSTRCGFREFCFQDGAFHLNGRRLFLKGSHTGADTPVGVRVAYDRDLLRKDLLNVKVMGFNMIRFIAGVARRYQLELCDEIGLLVYEESFAAWLLGDSPQMGKRYDDSVLGMIRRDRNHPSIVIWGLLNETSEGPVFRHAVDFLPKLRELDDSRMVILNSGRWDTHRGGVAGIQMWQNHDRTDPCVNRNSTDHVIQALGITWAPGQLAFHPGRDGEYAVVRWTAPADDRVDVAATFSSIAERATTDVHVLLGGETLFDALINVGDGGPTCHFAKTLDVKAGDTLDCVAGFGNGSYGADTTALDVIIKSASGKTYNATEDFSAEKNPNGPWSYGHLAAGQMPVASSFAAFPEGVKFEQIGSLSNPGSNDWEDVLSDQHPYQRVPHTADIIHTLRTLQGNGLPVFISEYGVGSAVDLARLARHYEQLGKTQCEDAQTYRRFLDLFLADWRRWRMADTFDRPEDYFRACLAKMAGQRMLGINAIRANPHMVGYSLTGTQDQGLTAEGLTTTFRELKPGTVDALFEAFYPLRWCLFVEPVNVYRGSKVRLEAVLANEDAMAPGKYPARLQVVGPNCDSVFDREITVTIPEPKQGDPRPFALPVFSEEIPIDGPAGEYRFLATFLAGGAATGGSVEFYVDDPAEMPPVETEVTLWGQDDELAAWLSDRGIRVRAIRPDDGAARQVILASGKPPGGATAFAELTCEIAQGSTVIFLSPEVFRRGDDPVGWLPLANKGGLTHFAGWVYLKDEWAKEHPIFAGLPAGGLMDYTFYREIIPDLMFTGGDPPAEAVAGAIKSSQGYLSGLLVSVHELGAGRFVLNTLNIRQNLGTHPAAERLLRNMLRDAARDTEKPPAELPPDFDSQLGAMGYQE